MAGGNRVVLTLAGDAGQLSKTFDEVGAGAEKMADRVESTESSFDKMGSGLDSLDDKAGGVEAGFRGTMDVMGGFGELAQGNVLQGVTDLGGGISDLASSFGTVLVPALRSGLDWLGKTRVGMLAQAAASATVSAATKTWTAIQAAFNVVMSLNPVVLIIAAIVALVAVIVLIATKTDWFSKLWERIWSVIGDPVKAVWSWISETLWPGIQMVWEGIIEGAKLVWEGIKKYFGFWRGLLERVVGWFGDAWRGARRNLDKIIDFVGDIPGRVGRALRGLGDALSAPFRAGFDAAKRFWNSTLGGKGFTIPSWVPFGLGGKSFTFPRFHQGGIVPGAPGQEVVAVLQAGERVTPAPAAAAARAGGVTIMVESGGGSSTDQAVAQLVLGLIRNGALRLSVRDGHVVVA